MYITKYIFILYMVYLERKQTPLCTCRLVMSSIIDWCWANWWLGPLNGAGFLPFREFGFIWDVRASAVDEGCPTLSGHAQEIQSMSRWIFSSWNIYFLKAEYKIWFVKGVTMINGLVWAIWWLGAMNGADFLPFVGTWLLSTLSSLQGKDWF